MIRGPIRKVVGHRADDRCEYCRVRQIQNVISHQIDHIIARQHGGSDDLDNLALACARCNGLKGTNISGLDPLTRVLSPLFHPRQDIWIRHFEFNGPVIIGLTPVGRTTVVVLVVNEFKRLQLRMDMIAQGDLY